MLRRTGVFVGLAALVAGLAAAPTALAVPAVSGEFPLGNEISASNHIVQGPDGNIWLTVGGAKDVAKVTPDGGVTEYDLAIEAAGGIAVGPENALWVTRNGGVTKFSPTDPEGTDESTIVEGVTSGPIALGPDGNLWAGGSEKLIRIPPGDPGNSKAFTIGGLNPRDIAAVGSQLAIADFNNRVLTATTSDPPVTAEYKLLGGSQGVAANASGQVGFSQQGQMPTEIGLLTPPGPPLMTPSPGTDPFGVALGPDGAFWVAQFMTATVTRLGTDNVVTTLSPGFAAGSGPRQLTPGPGNTLWVTLDNVDRIGRVSGVEAPQPPPPPPPTPEPRTKLKKGPKGKVLTTKARARVRFVFSSPDAGATFECRMIKVIRKKAKASKRKPKFKACKSPKAYKLKPGRYRFEVRAVLNGVRDKTPAKRSFKVIRVVRPR